MEIEQLAIPKKRAMEEYETYKEELRHAKTQFNEDMKSLYAHMRHGGKVLDLWESMKLAGLNDAGNPKLAIVQADSPRVKFERKLESHYSSEKQQWIPNGVNNGGIFYRQKKNGRWSPNWEADIKIPSEFLDYPKKPEGTYESRQIETVTPMVPARIMNAMRSHKLENYHILWEVEKWAIVPPKDPVLLKKITPNMFCILAAWDLSPLERAVIRGRL